MMMSSFAVVLEPVTIGTLEDATSLTAALVLMPIVLALAAVGLTLVRRGAGRRLPAPRSRSRGRPECGSRRPTLTTRSTLPKLGRKLG
jgi:hypothetical protein